MENNEIKGVTMSELYKLRNIVNSRRNRNGSFKVISPNYQKEMLKIADVKAKAETAKHLKRSQGK